MAVPTEYIILGFEGNHFSGEIVPEIAALVDRGMVRILDAVFLSRAPDGNLVALEIDEDEDLAVFAAIDGEIGGLIGPEDIAHAAAIEGGSSMLLIVWENLWLAPLAGAIRRAGGSVLEGGRIPDDLIEDAHALLATSV
jgi:hypothetical protein